MFRITCFARDRTHFKRILANTALNPNNPNRRVTDGALLWHFQQTVLKNMTLENARLSGARTRKIPSKVYIHFLGRKSKLAYECLVFLFSCLPDRNFGGHPKHAISTIFSLSPPDLQKSPIACPT